MHHHEVRARWRPTPHPLRIVARVRCAARLSAAHRVFEPAKPCAPSADPPRSRPFSATLTAGLGSPQKHKLRHASKLPQQLRAATAAPRLRFRGLPLWLSSCGGRRRAFVGSVREARQSRLKRERGAASCERATRVDRRLSPVGLFAILGLSCSYDFAGLRKLLYQVLRVHAQYAAVGPLQQPFRRMSG